MSLQKKAKEAGIRDKIHPNTLNYYQLPPDSLENEVAPLEILNANRLDVVVRIIYARACMTNFGLEWATKLYIQLITSQSGDFKKGDLDPGRRTMPEYIESFNALIQSMKKSGFDTKQTVIPTCQDTIVDGAHRLAIAIALNLKTLPTIELTGEPQKISYQDMIRFGMNLDDVNEVARQYLSLKPNARCAVMFPVSKEAHQKAANLLKEHFKVDFELTINMTDNGLKRLQTLLYGHHQWWSDKNAHDFMEKRRAISNPVKFIFFQESKEVRPVKEEMRKYHDADNHAFHTTDTHEEMQKLADIVYNKNALFYINHALEHKTSKFRSLLQEYKKLLPPSGAEHYAIDTGGVLALHGLRDVNDLDYLTTAKELKKSEVDIARHQGEYEEIEITTEEILVNPEHHLIVDGCKYVSLDTVTDLKKYRHTGKDLYDVSLIKHLKNKENFVPSIVFNKIKHTLHYRLYIAYHRTRAFIVEKLRQTLSKRTFEKIRTFYRTFKKDFS